MYFEREERGADTRQLYRRRGGEPPQQILDVPARLPGDSAHVSVAFWVPSPGGHRLVYGLARGGHDGLPREFVRGSSDLALVSPRAYLAAAGTRARR